MRNRWLVLGLVLAVVFAILAGTVLAQDGDEGLAPPEVDGEAVYIPFPVEITVDGDLSDWAQIQPITVARGPNKSGDPTENGSFTFQVAADMDNIYLAVTMPDQNIVTGQHGADTWNEDSLEFFLNASGILFAPEYEPGIFQARIVPSDIGNTDPTALTIAGVNPETTDITGFVFATDDGWGFEVAIALEPLGITPVHGTEVGFQVQANGATEMDRDVKLIWSLADTGDTSWNDPSVFGVGVFYEVGSDDVPPYSTPDNILSGTTAAAGESTAWDAAASEYLAPPEVDGEAVYIPFPVEIALDGDLSDWEQIQPVKVERGPYMSADPAENGSFTFQVAADMDNIYLVMTSVDQNIVTGEHGADTWNEDSLELYLNASGNLLATQYEPGIFQVRIIPSDIGNTDPTALTIAGVNPETTDITGYVFTTDDGWGFEVAIALEPLGITPEHGELVGFQAQSNGATELDRDVKLIWSLADEEDTSWNDPTVFGVGVFFEVGSDTVPAYAMPEDTVAEPAMSEPETSLFAFPVAVNQTGYYPSGPKFGMMAADVENRVSKWELVDVESGEVVISGATESSQYDEASGDFVSVADFSEWTEPGEYVLRIGEGESAPFVISSDIYQPLKVDALRYFYLNRSGIELDEAHAGEWARDAGHLSDAEITCWQGTDPQGVEWPGCDFEIDGSGGWYDAGDYGKYVVNGGITVWTLQNLYEQLPDAFPDGSLNIPESGNGVPDILDEARWEMDWMLRMQIPAGEPQAGMVFQKLHDRTWAGLPILPPTEYDNDPDNTNDNVGRYVYEPTTNATLNLAATAAQCARIWAEIDPDFAAQCLTAAETAWTAATENDLIIAGNVPGNGGGNYDDRDVSDEFFWAAAELYITTGDALYADFMAQHTLEAQVGPMWWGGSQPLGIISLLTVPNDLPDEIRADYEARVIASADDNLELLTSGGYRVPLALNDYVWGSNSGVMNNAIVMAMAYELTGDEAYLNAVAESMDYLLGRNALTFSFVTGYGEAAAQHQHHRFWANQGSYPPPPPGALAGGPNANPDEDAARNNAVMDSGPAKRYVDMVGSYSTNEVAINWNAPLTWVAAYLDARMGD